MDKVVVGRNGSAQVLQTTAPNSNGIRKSTKIQVGVGRPSFTFLNADLQADFSHRQNQMRKNLSKNINIADKGTIVKVPDVTGDIRKLVLKSYNDRMNSNGKQERSQWVTLLDATRGSHKLITKFQPGWLPVADLDPPEKLWRLVGNLRKNVKGLVYVGAVQPGGGGGAKTPMY